MTQDDVSTFVCQHCETSAPSTSISYTVLGYSVCPTCASTTGPRHQPSSAATFSSSSTGSTVEQAADSVRDASPVDDVEFRWN